MAVGLFLSRLWVRGLERLKYGFPSEDAPSVHTLPPEQHHGARRLGAGIAPGHAPPASPYLGRGPTPSLGLAVSAIWVAADCLPKLPGSQTCGRHLR